MKIASGDLGVICRGEIAEVLKIQVALKPPLFITISAVTAD